MHARWPTRFRSDHACTMRVASASAARCTACGCTGRTRVLRREQAEHFGRCKHLPLPCARHLTRCCSWQRCALLGRCSCSAVDAAGWTARRRSQLCKHTEAPFRNRVHSWSIQGRLTNKLHNRPGETVLNRPMRFHANRILLESLEAVYFADGELVVCPWDLESEIPEADDDSESAQLFADD